MRRFLFLLPVALTSCTTMEQQDNAEEARFRSFKGMTMAQFMAATMITPTDSYESGGQRIFVARKQAIDPRFGCSIQLETVPNGGSDADGWTILRTRRQGGCSQV